MTPLGTWLLGDGLLGADNKIDERAELLPTDPSAAVITAAESAALIDSDNSEAKHP